MLPVKSSNRSPVTVTRVRSRLQQCLKRCSNLKKLLSSWTQPTAWPLRSVMPSRTHQPRGRPANARTTPVGKGLYGTIPTGYGESLKFHLTDHVFYVQLNDIRHGPALQVLVVPMVLRIPFPKLLHIIRC